MEQTDQDINMTAWSDIQNIQLYILITQIPRGRDTLCRFSVIFIGKTIFYDFVFTLMHNNPLLKRDLLLTLVLLNLDIPCICKQCRSWSVGQIRMVKIQEAITLKPTDLDLHCLPLSVRIYNKNPDQVIWLAENWSGRGILIYSAGQGLKERIENSDPWKCIHSP